MSLEKPELPKYRHIETGEEINALRIAGIVWTGPALGTADESPTSYQINFDQFSAHGPVQVDQAWYDAHNPKPGDFYARREDGTVFKVNASEFVTQYERL
jgi:hypothetical protein